MPKPAVRAFRVHARHIDTHHARLVKETSFEAAAISYIEDYPHAPDDEEEISVIVRELGSGHEHCFKINFETGETETCG
jgi:hypothetical protein